MEKNKTPVIIVFVILSFLIIASIAALIFLKKSDDSGTRSQKTERREAVIDFELSQLAEKAERLVNEDLAKALRQGDVPIDFMSSLGDDLKKADRELSGGDFKKARSHYNEIVAVAETKLEELKFAKSARELKDSIYIKLSDSEHLKNAFENTYSEAVDTYNQGLQNLESGKFKESIDLFETTGRILEELREQSVQQLEAQLESARIALSEFDPVTARSSFERVLEIDATNAVAEKGLLDVEALDAIVEEVESFRLLQESGKNEEALSQINALIEKNPDNTFLLGERKKIEAAVADDKREAIIERADAAEAEGDLTAAIAALKEANKIRAEEELTERIKQLKIQEKEKHLKTLLETGYNSLKAGNYEAARMAYEDVLRIDPKSKEARAGIEKTSSLYLASIRYDQSIESAAKYLSEGRIPLATKFFNEALESRPNTISFKQKDEEARIREALESQREKVNVLIVSDGKTYVSMIGVFVPERFKKKEIMLYPDVYKLKGTRRNFLPVETDVKVHGNMKPEGVEIICTEKL